MGGATFSELAVGDWAPDFTLPCTTGSDVTLSSYRGSSNVLLAFFPLAFTGTCTAEMCAFTTDVSKFQDVNTKVLGISIDSIPTLNEFKAKHGITIDLLSDFKREVSRSFGVLIEDLFFSRRAYFAIDERGKVAWKHVEDDLGERRDNVQLLRELSKI